MLKRVLPFIAVATSGVVLSLDAQPQPSPFKRTILQRADVPGINLELVYATVDIAAGARAGRHTHPGVAMALVVEGDFWFQLDGQPERIAHSTTGPFTMKARWTSPSS